MRLARVLTDTGPQIAVITDTGDHPRATLLEATRFADLFGNGDWRHAATSALNRDETITGPVMLSPADETTRIFCVGHNYRQHIREMGRPVPEHPTIFYKMSSATVGPHDDILLPASSAAMDWEAELAVVLADELRDAPEDHCRRAIAGYTLINDVTARDWQHRTSQWFAGKNFEQSTPLGPVVVTPDELPQDSAGQVDIEIRCEVNGVTRQRARTSDLVFGVPALLSYLSRSVGLRPGDIVATGTPGGVGAAMSPPVFLQPGDVVRTDAAGIGACLNRCRRRGGPHDPNIGGTS
ncbi:fumarylacetoacetate hydrolase family protein [Nonomuraea sp. FMUSA5-5]|uniref:Fumarylacetoacetate hydrolase family protein n=1 Tax=Nonomuraea composti TaxID=2720023 RepID=A0ABX1BP87_9ACTN|nr:fumarylacetoacetate hydrolase family protein [Nonomuraea sp. FMUSA5-5]NJP97086.1 fumarylacetoacetate hydrolase family protein [Nonomuraea sp. FMUSA5-5]